MLAIAKSTYILTNYTTFGKKFPAALVAQIFPATQFYQVPTKKTNIYPPYSQIIHTSHLLKSAT